MRTKVLLVLIAVYMLSLLSACKTALKYEGIETVMFTDDAGRRVELPANIRRVAPSGAVATMILSTLCPDYLVSVSASPSSKQYKILAENLIKLPTTGQLYGSKSTINLESLLKAAPEVIIDLGDRKDGIASDMDKLQQTTGIAVIYIEADLAHLAQAYRTLGAILSLEVRAEELASFIDETVSMAADNSARLGEMERKRVMYTSGTSGLNTNAAGSVQAQVLDIVGARNAVVVEDISNQGGGNTIGLEQLYNIDPEIILFAGSSIYSTVGGMEAWSDLAAIKSGAYYEIPTLPYNWMSGPPSINMVLGVWWLGNLLYPELYDYDIVTVAQRIFKLLWAYDLSYEEAFVILEKSTFKRHT